ncbi:conserved membrane hypothetical protein [Desulfosarcina cetonica]|uniref:hypothetical protein n=1 Tax=Desulfosarcina cetonica TaxID=90730 RepID=UPI0006D10D5B|nr:hypothetical protein [Desulfosarcina cetonica]VTR68424.1 conserved membrane hypothetical protein [Desulfosarcina cetonica]
MKRTVRIAITTAQLLAIAALAIVEGLSGYRAGVMQYLYFKKIHYLETLYSPGHLGWHLVFLSICVLVIIMLTNGRQRKQHLVRYTVACCALAAAYLVPWFHGLNSYAHLLIVLEGCAAAECIGAWAAS